MDLDHTLVARARSLITEANVYRAIELIFMYERALLLHNGGAPGHEMYHDTHEKDLRNFVTVEIARQAQTPITPSRDMAQLLKRNQAVMRRAGEIIAKAERAQKRSTELSKRVNEALQPGTRKEGGE